MSRGSFIQIDSWYVEVAHKPSSFSPADASSEVFPQLIVIIRYASFYADASGEVFRQLFPQLIIKICFFSPQILIDIFLDAEAKLTITVVQPELVDGTQILTGKIVDRFRI